MTPVTGLRTFAVTTARKFTAGQPVFVVSRSTPSSSMFGQFISYDASGLKVNVTNASGMGITNDWDIFAAGGYQLGDSCMPQACTAPAGRLPEKTRISAQGLCLRRAVRGDDLRVNAGQRDDVFDGGAFVGLMRCFADAAKFDDGAILLDEPCIRRAARRAEFGPMPVTF